MKLLRNKEIDYDLKKYLKEVIFEDELLFHRFNISINEEYRFVYDEFFEHLLDDTNNIVKKLKYELPDILWKNKNEYNKERIQINNFKKIFHSHIYSEKYNYNRLKNPDKDSYFRQQLRKLKLKNLQDEM